MVVSSLQWMEVDYFMNYWKWWEAMGIDTNYWPDNSKEALNWKKKLIR